MLRPSANRFGHTSPTTAEHVLADLDGRIDAILDAGGCDVGVESTVLDPTADPAIIYRPGGITAEQIREVLGNVVVAERKSLRRSSAGIAGISGPGNPSLCAACAGGAGGERGRTRPRAGARGPRTSCRSIAAKRLAVPRRAVNVLPWGNWSDPELLARELYRQMRALDEQGVEVIVCPMPPAGEGIGLAIRDRLRKSAK